MKVLYAIQGTGTGHISRALEILPLLKKRAEVDVLVSASQWELNLPFEVKYRYHGLGFVFGKKGGVDILRTYLKLDTLKLFNEIKRLPVEDYDLVEQSSGNIASAGSDAGNKGQAGQNGPGTLCTQYCQLWIPL
jgi:hypothetical protein